MPQNMSYMKRDLRSDLERLHKLAFRMEGKCGPILNRFHACRSKINTHPASSDIWRVYDWLIVPFSLWPIDFLGFANHLLSLIESNGDVDKDILLLLELVGNTPDAETQLTVGAFEHFVEAGQYDHLLRQPEKFQEGENIVKRDEELKKTWQQIKQRWDVSAFKNPRGVIRRRMSQERNFRENWAFDWSDQKGKFHLFFDVMCYRWRLYGMENDDPLLLKITVNPTPHGTMIVIPRHWSLDLARDLHWNKIGKLHRSHKPIRQGPKLSPARIEKYKEAKQVLKFWNEAGAKRICGDSRYESVLSKMRRTGGTESAHNWVKRLLQLARGKKKPSS
jgi:hypothetical protein